MNEIGGWGDWGGGGRDLRGLGVVDGAREAAEGAAGTNGAADGDLGARAVFKLHWLLDRTCAVPRG